MNFNTYGSGPNNAELVLYGGDKFVCLTSSNGQKQYYSTNGPSWSFTETSMYGPQRFIAYGNGLWVSFPSSADDERVTRYYTSTDGITWTYRTISTSLADPWHWYDLKFINGKFYALGETYQNLYSSDGVSWTKWSVSGYPSLKVIAAGEVEA
jgi:hypothetical protein